MHQGPCQERELDFKMKTYFGEHSFIKQKAAALFVSAENSIKIKGPSNKLHSCLNWSKSGPDFK